MASRRFLHLGKPPRPEPPPPLTTLDQNAVYARRPSMQFTPHERLQIQRRRAHREALLERLKGLDHSTERRLAKARISAVKNTQCTTDILDHCARHSKGGHHRAALTAVQELAAGACFDSLQKVIDPADGIEKVGIGELCLALRTLGYTEDEEDLLIEVMINVDGSSADGKTRVGLEEFSRLLGSGAVHLGRHTAASHRLTSIGKVRAAAGVEHAHLRDQLQNCANDAYPFAVVADSLRISELVSSVAPAFRERMQRERERASFLLSHRHDARGAKHQEHVAAPSPRGPPGARRPNTATGGLARSPRRSPDVYGLGGQIARGSFDHPGNLEAWMIHVGLDTSRWDGAAGRRTVRDLFGELQARECTVQKMDGVVYRCVSVVNLVVRQPLGAGRHLHCYRQRIGEEVPKIRNVLPSAKLVEGEEPVAVARRAVLEQMGGLIGGPADVRVAEGSLLSWYEIDESPSFPSLRTQYRLHQLEVVVHGLPEGRFATRLGNKEFSWQWLEDSPSDGRRTKAEAKVTASANTAAAAEAVYAPEAGGGGGGGKPRRRGSICL